MCAIYGLLSRDRSRSAAERIRAASRRLKHRGPDQSRFWSDAHAYLGHHRLALRDPRGGFQPFESACGRWVTIAAGEILNEGELRSGLEAAGARFRSDSDCEVLARLFEMDGAGSLCRMSGQFAAAVWDRRSRRLHLFRDRYGISPLFFAFHRNELAFASEARAAADLAGMAAEPDWIGVGQALYFWASVPPRTAYAGVSELPPGCVLTAEPGREPRIRSFVPRQKPRILQSKAASPSVIRGLVGDSVREAARAAGPVGVYLSGGLDSSAILALAAERGRTKRASLLRPFGLSFERVALDDAAAQKQAASAAGSSLTRVIYDEAKLPQVFEAAVGFIEKPLARTGFAAFYELARRVRESGVRAALAGEGADEFFWGYDIFYELRIRLEWARRPGAQTLASGLRKLHAESADPSGRSSALWEEFFRIPKGAESGLFVSHEPRWRSAMRNWKLFDRNIRSLWSEASMRRELTRALPEDYRMWNPFRRAQYLEMNLFTRDYLLGSQGDRMAMAHGLEVRYPYLDPRIESAAGDFPSGSRTLFAGRKAPLRRAMRGILPAAILRRSKKPFRAPRLADVWRSQGSRLARSRDWLQDALSPSNIRKYPWLDAEEIARLRTRLETSRFASESDEAALCVVMTATGWMKRMRRGTDG